jgi:hypothetical protein
MAADTWHPAPPRPVGCLRSPLLRHIRATAGPGSVYATDTWSAKDGFRLEANDDPPCLSSDNAKWGHATSPTH